MLQTRTLIGLAIAGFLLLFAINFLSNLGIGKNITGTQSIRLRPGDIQETILFYKKVPYVLNFEQQNKLISHINKAVPIPKLSNPPTSTVDGVERIVIYRFSQPEIILTPVGTSESNVYFLAPYWYETGYLMDITGLELRRLFKEIHD